MSEIQLLHGDCLALLPTLPLASVDLICCDLPYGSTRCRWDTPIDLAALWRQYQRIAKPSAAILLFAQAPFDKVLACSNLPWFRYEWVWEKTLATGHLNAKRMPLKAHELILVFYAGQPTYRPQKTEGHVRKVATKRSDTTALYGAQKFAPLPYDSTQRYPRSVLRFASDTRKLNLHPTQKPQALLEYLVATYSNEGDTVLDNCMGSGTTGAACQMLGRNFIGIEQDAAYFQIAQERLNKLSEAA